MHSVAIVNEPHQPVNVVRAVPVMDVTLVQHLFKSTTSSHLRLISELRYLVILRICRHCFINFRRMLSPFMHANLLETLYHRR